MNLCALITLYNPDEEKLKFNISQIKDYVGKVYLLCNSRIDFLIEDEKICLVDNKKNIGLSAAFNIGIEKAKKEGFDHAILFDQDSVLVKENFKLLYEDFLAEGTNVACIGPSLNVRGNLISIPRWSMNLHFKVSKNVVSVKNVITSGMLLKISTFDDVGGFDERFPVDFCDFTFCWKCICKGYAVLQSKRAFINHEVGNAAMKIGRSTIHFHASYRNYFLVRDTLNIVFRNKPTPVLLRFRFLFLLPVRMILFLVKCDRKKERLKMYFLGFCDFLRNVHGYGCIAKLLGAE